MRAGRAAPGDATMEPDAVDGRPAAVPTVGAVATRPRVRIVGGG